MPTKKSSILLLFLLLICCSACAKWKGALGIDANLYAVANGAVDKLILNTRLPLDNDTTTVLVASLVNIDSLQQSSTFGRTMAEYINSAFVIRDFSAYEIKLRRDLFVMQKTGELLLSREVDQISSKHNAQAVVVGTYSRGEYVVYLSLRLVRAHDNVILSTAEVNIPLGVEMHRMLQNDRLR